MNAYQVLLLVAGGFLVLTGIFGILGVSTGFDSPYEKTHKLCIGLAVVSNICMWLSLAGLVFVALGELG
jgi:hypothetical protein